MLLIPSPTLHAGSCDACIGHALRHGAALQTSFAAAMMMRGASLEYCDAMLVEAVVLCREAQERSPLEPWLLS